MPRRIGPLVAALALSVAAGLQPAQAQISYVSMFRNISYEQTGNGDTTSLNGAFCSLGLTSENANDFSTVSTTYPGPASPVSLSQTDATDFAYQTSLLPNQAAMDAQFPMGTYTFNANGNAGPNTASFDYSSDTYAASMPYLAGTSYSALQNANPNTAIPVQFSAFDTGTGASESYIFFTVYDYNTQSTVISDDGFLSPTTTGVTIPAGTLQYGNNYDFELDYSNRDSVASPGAEFDALLGFDMRVDGLFSTMAAPAPPPLLTCLAAYGCLGILLRRSRPSPRTTRAMR
jgi:hypothetical protein